MHLPKDTKAKIAERYAAGERAAALAEEFGITHRTVLNIVDRWVAVTGSDFRRRPRKYLSLREDAFSEVTEESAYWIGFLMADGCVFGNNLVKLSLATVDRPHVEKFRDFLGSGHKVSDRPNESSYGGGGEMISVIQVKSKSLVSDLACFGVTPRKSRTATVIGLEDNSDFWRGMIDGDGTIGVDEDGTPRITLYGCSPILGQFAGFVRSFTGTRLSVTPHPTVRRVGMAGRTALDVIRRLYLGATVSLDRKQAIADQIIASEWAALAGEGRPRQWIARDSGALVRGPAGRIVGQAGSAMKASKRAR